MNKQVATVSLHEKKNSLFVALYSLPCLNFAFELNQSKKKERKRVHMGVPDVNKQTAIIFTTKLDLEKRFFLHSKGFISSIGIAPRKCQQKNGKKASAFLYES